MGGWDGESDLVWAAPRDTGSMSLLKVRVIGCAGVGKRSLRKVVCKQFPVPGADVEDEDFDDDDDTVEHQAYLNSQTTVVVREHFRHSG